MAVEYVCSATDSTSFNYDASATDDDGSCVPFVIGCMDSIAFNFDSKKL